MTIDHELRRQAIVFRDRDRVPMHVIQSAAQQLVETGELCVAFDSSSNQTAEIEAENIRRNLSALAGKASLAVLNVFQIGESFRVFALYHGLAVVSFVEAPWHPQFYHGAADRLRLARMLMRRQPFVASFIFDDQPNHREDGPGAIGPRLVGMLTQDDLDSFRVSLIRRDWPAQLFKGKCRIDILVEPPPVTLDEGDLRVTRGRQVELGAA